MDKLKREVIDKAIINAENRDVFDDSYEKDLIESLENIEIQYHTVIDDYYMYILGFLNGERHIYIGLPEEHSLTRKFKEDDFPNLSLNGGQLYVGASPYHCGTIQELFDKERWIIGSLLCEDMHGRDPELIKSLNTEEDANEIFFHNSINESSIISDINVAEKEAYSLISQLKQFA